MKNSDNSTPASLLDIMSNSGGWDDIEVRDYDVPDYDGPYMPEGSQSVTLDDLESEASEQRWYKEDEPEEPAPVKEKKDRSTFNYFQGFLAESADKVEKILVETKTDFFVRGGMLVRPIMEDVRAYGGGWTKSNRLKEINVPYIINTMSRKIAFIAKDKKGETYNIDPPTNLAVTLLSRDGEWSFPHISGVINAPTIRPDGSILYKPGYDPETRLLLINPPKLGPMPKTPSKDDAMKALTRLDKLLDSFPFVDRAGRSVALSGLITPVVRPSISVTPMHVMSAPTAGSGKTFLVDLCCAILTGNRSPVITVGKTEDETEKRLGSELLEGGPIITLDNVNGQLYGDILCQAVERPMLRIRILGQSKTVQIENKCTIFATGNNISIVDDMTRRSVMCLLDPNMERPELRQFKTNPYQEIINNRGNYIADAITIIRAYILAGSPERLPRLASFEEWSDTVRSALVWLGQEDPIKSMESTRQEDTRLSSAKALVAAWYEILVSQKKTASELVEMSLDGDKVEFQSALRDFVSPKSGPVNSQNLGARLRSVKGKVLDGLKISFEYDPHSKVNAWFLEKL